MHVGKDDIDAFTSTVKRCFYLDVIKCAGVYYFNEPSRIPHWTFYRPNITISTTSSSILESMKYRVFWNGNHTHIYIPIHMYRMRETESRNMERPRQINHSFKVNGMYFKFKSLWVLECKHWLINSSAHWAEKVVNSANRCSFLAETLPHSVAKSIELLYSNNTLHKNSLKGTGEHIHIIK